MTRCRLFRLRRRYGKHPKKRATRSNQQRSPGCLRTLRARYRIASRNLKLTAHDATRNRGTPRPTRGLSGGPKGCAKRDWRVFALCSLTDPKAALEHAQQLEPTLTAHAEEFTNERVILPIFRAQIQAAQIQIDADARAQRGWERALAQIESLSKQGISPGLRSWPMNFLSSKSVPKPSLFAHGSWRMRRY